jgi:DNA (cytosine-5)-methyltransferase 1
LTSNRNLGIRSNSTRPTALTFPLDGFDAIHASPPCQGYSAMNRAGRADHDRLIGQVRERLIESGLPWVIENVEGARRDMLDPLTLCGTHFGLAIRRHRLFESSALIPAAGTCACRNGVVEGWLIGARRGGKPSAGRRRPPASTEAAYRDAIGVPWMTCKESRQAIPPAYTRWVGSFLPGRVAA